MRFFKWTLGKGRLIEIDYLHKTEPPADRCKVCNVTPEYHSGQDHEYVKERK